MDKRYRIIVGIKCKFEQFYKELFISMCWGIVKGTFLLMHQSDFSEKTLSFQMHVSASCLKFTWIVIRIFYRKPLLSIVCAGASFKTTFFLIWQGDFKKNLLSFQMLNHFFDRPGLKFLFELFSNLSLNVNQKRKFGCLVLLIHRLKSLYS